MGLSASAIKSAFEKRLDHFDFENIEILEVGVEPGGDAVVTFGDDENEYLEVLFTFDEDDGPLAVLLDPETDHLDDEDDELDIIELGPLEPNTLDFGDGQLGLDLLNLGWLNENTLQAILTAGDLIDDQEDAEGKSEMSERSVVVVRGGKKVRLPVVRRRRKKRLTAKQRAAIKRGVRKRKQKKSAIARKRKRSLKLRKRSGLKKNTNKNLKTKGTSLHKR